MKTMKFLTLAILTVLFFASCSKDDSVDQPEPQQQQPEPQQASSPTNLTYSITQTNVAFYTAGSISAPTVDWNGETGTFSLSASYAGVTINTTTGVIRYNKYLPLGESLILIKAENSKGYTTSEIRINHQFEGNFSGGWNNDPNSTVLTSFGLTMNFNTDGTMTINAGGDAGTGTWNLIPNGGNGQIKATFTFTGSPTAYQFYGDTIYNDAIVPIIEGPFKIAGASSNQGHMHLEM